MKNISKIIANLRAKLERQLLAVENTENHIELLTTLETGDPQQIPLPEEQPPKKKSAS